jgi:hypothetical protein
VFDPEAPFALGFDASLLSQSRHAMLAASNPLAIERPPSLHRAVGLELRQVHRLDLYQQPGTGKTARARTATAPVAIAAA